MARRRAVGSAAWLLVASWGVFVLSYATVPPPLPLWLLGASIVVGVTFTSVAAWVVVLAQTESRVPAIRVTAFVILLILLLALLPRLGG